MQTTESPARADRQLSRLVDVHASTEAAAALHAAATSAPQNAVLAAADAVLRGAADDATRDRLRDALVSKDFVPQLRGWMRELREVASAWPDSGACTVATAMKLWSLTVDHFRGTEAQAADDLAEPFCRLIAARCLVLDAVTEKSQLRLDLAHVYCAHASSLAGAACAELVFGYRRHLLWDAEGCATCYAGEDLDDLEAVMPGIASGAGTTIDVLGANGSHPAKRGPCVRFEGVDTFMRWRNKLDGCLTGSRAAKDRAAAAIARRAS